MRPRYLALARGWLYCLALAVLLAFAGGCALYLDPGPNPAHLLVGVQASVTPRMVEEALIAKARLVYDPLGGVEEVSTPLWDLRAFVPNPDGHYTPLQPLRPQENMKGYDFAGTAEFMVPPGVRQIFLLLECSVRHVEQDGPIPMVHYVYIIVWRHNHTLELCPGCRLEVKPFADRSAQP